VRHVLLAMLLAGSACVGMNVGSVEGCAELCAKAAGCGFLPSVLGYSDDGDVTRSQQNCEWRCSNSQASDPTAAAISRCFTATDPLAAELAWCTDETDERHADWSECTSVNRCLQEELGQHQLHGDADLTVQAVSFTDYEERFGSAIAELYPAQAGEEAQAVTSCTPSLCGAARCDKLECAADECDEAEAEDEICDSTLCSVGMLTVSMVCADLGATEITLTVKAKTRLPVVDVFVDAAADLNPGCKESTVTLDSDAFNLEPGPLQVVARVVGELPAGRLFEIGMLADPGPDDEALMPYCLEFIGPAVIAHTGENTAVVPIGAVDELKELIAAGGELRRCKPCPAATLCAPAEQP
jgi:hypothetical protein